jgi:predicted alpha/beta-hydrolase family hydrolase
MHALSLDTPRGPARVLVHEPAGQPAALVVLLHGAGTDTSRPPLPFLADLLADGGLLAVRLDQPWVVAGRRVAAPAGQLDEVLLAALPALRALAPAGAPLGVAGRSSGARVACRTAAAAGTDAVAALGFPFRPPGKDADRAAELRAGAAACPVLVVQGERDPFGAPPRMRGVRLTMVPGVGHTPSEAGARLAARWLLRSLGAPLRAA